MRESREPAVVDGIGIELGAADGSSRLVRQDDGAPLPRCEVEAYELHIEPIPFSEKGS